MFIAVSDFGARKQNHLKPDTSGSIFASYPYKFQISHPTEGLTRPIVKWPRFSFGEEVINSPHVWGGAWT